MCSFFFFNDTATTEIYTLSLHDALPIYVRLNKLAVPSSPRPDINFSTAAICSLILTIVAPVAIAAEPESRSEEHTSELQSQSNLVCRLLLEKKKRTQSRVQVERVNRADI